MEASPGSNPIEERHPTPHSRSLVSVCQYCEGPIAKVPSITQQGAAWFHRPDGNVECIARQTLQEQSE